MRALTLGGKNPFIVLEDADIELAARAKASGNRTRIGTRHELDEHSNSRWMAEMKVSSLYTLANG